MGSRGVGERASYAKAANGVHSDQHTNFYDTVCNRFVIMLPMECAHACALTRPFSCFCVLWLLCSSAVNLVCCPLRAPKDDLTSVPTRQ